MTKQIPMLGEHELEPFPEIRYIEFKERYIEQYKKQLNYERSFEQ